jgi:hypothetical protein
MTDYDIQWQDRITKVVRRVAKDLISLDETEISEVVRRRLFEDLGSEKIRKNVAKLYADWCFERRAQLPPEWTKQRGKSPRLYPGSLVWCIKRPGRDLREKIELWLAWKRVAREIVEGTLGSDFDRGDRAEIQSKVADAEEAAMGRISLCSSR